MGAILVFSCEQHKVQDKTSSWYSAVSSPNLSKPLLKVKRDTSFVRGLLPIGGDTLIAIKGDGGITISVDAGVHWKTTHEDRHKPDFLLINDLAYDNNKVLWGLYSWQGIHEADAARIGYSRDFGKTWAWHKFDTRIFFPLNFYSEVGQPLQVVTHTGKVFQLQDHEGKQWKFLKHVPYLDGAHLDTTFDETRLSEQLVDKAQYRFLDNGKLLARTSAGWKSITTIGFVDRVNEACTCDSSLYITAHKDAINPSPYYLLKINRGQVRHIIITEEGWNHIRCDKTGKLWVYSDSGIWEVMWGTALKKRY
jgi:hypothetical protein